MYILIFIAGLIIGKVLNILIDNISNSITKDYRKTFILLIPSICAVSFEILFFKFGFTILLAKTIVMTVILIVISVIDIRHRIIPDFIVAITLVIGVIFSFLVRASLLDTLFGMVFGGGILLLLSLVPNVMGGGDIKLMFALGAFLGLNRTLWALLLAFILSSIISIALILFKVKGTKDYIPFGPFLSLGSFISLVVFV